VFTDPNEVYQFLKGKDPLQRTQIIAYFLAPAFILGISIYGLFGLSINFDKPVAISELRMEIGEKGEYTSKRGVVLIAEPTECEFGLQLGTASKIWSSLDEQMVAENIIRNHLGLKAGTVSGNTPFLGDRGPVALVIDGNLGETIDVSGAREPVDDWRLISRQSSSLLSGAFAGCLLTFGMTFALGMSPVNGDENNASKKRTEPDKD
jgi:hypothetical protein